uniref:NAD-dependent epimerase/dehydratase family protein n=1 Tax=Thermosphaera aggregans TaxID=54254 RepID=A0A7C2BKC3_9CREN
MNRLTIYNLMSWDIVLIEELAMKVLVTGGAGFIGHHIALHLDREGFEVSVLDSLQRANPLAITRLRESGIPLIVGDVRTFQEYGGFDIVVHAAALVNVEESIRNPLEYYDVNIMGTARVGYECSKNKIRLIYLSSAAVYGEPVKTPVSERDPVNPLSPYGLSKLVGEQILGNYSRIYGLKHVSLRLFNVYGPGQNPSYAGVISRFLTNAIEGKSLEIYGDGFQTRDFIHVEDVARVVEKVYFSRLFSTMKFTMLARVLGQE